jgi:hypothetical protein
MRATNNIESKNNEANLDAHFEQQHIIQQTQA